MEMERDETWRIHNLPENADLGPCRCPVCDPAFHEEETK